MKSDVCRAAVSATVISLFCLFFFPSGVSAINPDGLRISTTTVNSDEPAWDPASEKIIFEKQWYQSAADGNWRSIWMVRGDAVDTSTEKKVADGPATLYYDFARSPSWTGTTGDILFHEAISSKYEYYLFDVPDPYAAGFTALQKTTNDSSQGAFSQKVYTNYGDYTAGGLARVSRDGQKVLLRHAKKRAAPSAIVDVKIYVADFSLLPGTGQALETWATGNSLTPVITAEESNWWDCYGNCAFNHGASFSPDHSSFVISDGTDIWLYDLEAPVDAPVNLTEGLHSGTPSALNYIDPDFSPDGMHIICAGKNWDPDHWTDPDTVMRQYRFSYDLFLLNASPAGPANLTNISNTQYASEYRPSWSPDGDRVAFAGLSRNANASPQNAGICVRENVVGDDCNANSIRDMCDISASANSVCTYICTTLGMLCGTKTDCNSNGVPDECETDTDGDNMIDACDACPSNGTKAANAGLCGCSVNSPEPDSDSDGTPDCIDSCPDDPAKTAVGACGCGNADTDTDGDGKANCIDSCPDDPNKTAAGACGCGNADTDSDGDGKADCIDGCPSDNRKINPGACGCGTADTDRDGDSSADCVDECPDDSGKNSVGICGCGISDTDGDNDGTSDCNDLCPQDAAKTSPGACGCGTTDADADGDGVVDCQQTGIQNIVPPKPRLSMKKKWAIVKMTHRNGVKYVLRYLQLTGKKSIDKKAKAKIVRSTRETATIKGLKANRTLAVSYHYESSGTGALSSKESRQSRMKVKFRK